MFWVPYPARLGKNHKKDQAACGDEQSGKNTFIQLHGEDMSVREQVCKRHQRGISRCGSDYGMGTDSFPNQHIETMRNTMFKELLTNHNPDISEEYLKITQSVEYKKVS
jgi:hypothetical protein